MRVTLLLWLLLKHMERSKDTNHSSWKLKRNLNTKILNQEQNHKYEQHSSIKSESSADLLDHNKVNTVLLQELLL